jgi:hypothetical protein
MCGICLLVKRWSAEKLPPTAFRSALATDETPAPGATWEAYCAKTNETGSVKVPFAVGLNFQLAFTQRAAALANMGGPELSVSTIFPPSTVIVTRTSPEMCN